MLLGIILKIGEPLLIATSTKNHFKEPLYDRNLEDLSKYIRYFNKLPIEFFLPNLDSLSINRKKLSTLQKESQIISFHSPFVPLPPFDVDYAKELALQIIKIHFIPLAKLGTKNPNSNSKNRAIIYLHGWGRNSFFIEQKWLFRFLKNAYQADIFALELPYHHSRNPKGFSGQGFLDADPIRTIEAFRQAVSETYYLYQLLKQNYQEIGLVGISLGAHIVTMVNLLLSKDIFSIACLVGTPLRQNLKNLTISPNLMRTLKHKEVYSALSILDFTRIKSNHSNHNFFLVGGIFDPIIDPKTVIRLGKHFNCCTYLLPTRHFSLSMLFPMITSKIAIWK